MNIFGPHTPEDQPLACLNTIILDQFTFQHYRIADTLFSASIVDKCVKSVRNPTLIATPHFPLGILSDRYAFFIAPILSNGMIEKNLVEIPLTDYKKMRKLTYERLIEKARDAGVDASDRKKYYCKEDIIYAIYQK